MRLPEPQALQPEFQRRGFVFVAELLDECERSTLFDVAHDLVQRHSAAVDRSANGQRLSYRVVTGERIEAEGPALFRFYTEPDVLRWIRTLTASPELGVSPHLRSAINVNCLRTAGQCYPWHRDAVPYTALLFLSSVPPIEGGAFAIRAADNDALLHVQPMAGGFLFMDGARCAHAVLPLVQDTLRLTVPMVYPKKILERPAGLDEYLYGGLSNLQSGKQGR